MGVMEGWLWGCSGGLGMEGVGLVVWGQGWWNRSVGPGVGVGQWLWGGDVGRGCGVGLWGGDVGRGCVGLGSALSP